MKVRFTPKQAHTGDQAYQAKIMITVQMRNKNMVDTASLDTVFCNLHLGSFAAVGMIENHLRLPLVPLSDQLYKSIRGLLDQMKN